MCVFVIGKRLWMRQCDTIRFRVCADSACVCVRIGGLLMFLVSKCCVCDRAREFHCAPFTTFEFHESLKLGTVFIVHILCIL